MRGVVQRVPDYPPKRSPAGGKQDGAERTFRLLFTTDHGKVYHRSVLNHGGWKRALVSAGVKPPRERGAPRYAAAPEDGMRTLRRACTSVLLDAGKTTKATLTECLGRLSDPGFTPLTCTWLMPVRESRTRKAINAACVSRRAEGLGEGDPRPCAPDVHGPP